jgi:nickel-dependent lactate racemase
MAKSVNADGPFGTRRARARELRGFLREEQESTARTQAELCKSIGSIVMTARVKGGHTLTKMACWLKMSASKLLKIEQGEIEVSQAWLNSYFTLVESQAKKRLEYIRGELKAERISYGELAELQNLREYITTDDVQLLEAAAVPEHP